MPSESPWHYATEAELERVLVVLATGGKYGLLALRPSGGSFLAGVCCRLDLSGGPDCAALDSTIPPLGNELSEFEVPGHESRTRNS